MVFAIFAPARFTSSFVPFTHGPEITDNATLRDSQLGTFDGGCLEGDPNATPPTFSQALEQVPEARPEGDQKKPWWKFWR